ncbi:MAG: hypothetical protein H6660_05835 [Ardenticatenaceae bacterium]|nr:hypothetical protein [Ardenticatenaceae bacterium]
MVSRTELIMKSFLTFAGQLNFQSNTEYFTASNFLRSLLVDLELAKSNHVLHSFSIRNYSVRFSMTPISKRFLKHPFGYLSVFSYPNHYRQFILFTASLSRGELLIEQIDDLISISYSLNFSEIFRWALFLFTGCLLFGLLALTWETRIEIFIIGLFVLSFMIFGLYYGFGVIGTLLRVRSYLKNRMKEIIK